MKPLAPDLFQRRFQDLVEIGHARIPALVPQWTDHNAHDPGIMLMELLAWVAEAQLYSLSRQRRDERAAYAELLGVPQSGTRAAHGLIWSDSLDPNSPALKFDHSVVIKDDAVINVLSVDTPTFRPTHKLLWVPGQISKLEAHLADGSVIDFTTTNQRGGVAFFPLGDSAGPKDRLRLTFEARGKSGLFGPNRKDAKGALWAIGVRSATSVGSLTDFVRVPERSCHSPIEATLLADDQRLPLEIKYDSTSGLLETGVLLLSLEKVSGSPQECTIELRASHGLPRPPQLLRLEPSVIPIEQGRPISEELQIENPIPDWSFKLAEPGLKFKPGKTPVQIEVREAAGVYSWDLRKDLSEFGPDERVYELNTTTGEITFGNGVNGKIPGVGSRLFVSYAVCDGAGGNIARDRQWTVSGLAGAFGVNVDPVAGGAAAPGLPEQRRKARLRSRDEHALITSEDIVNAAKALPLLDVARAWVVPPEKNHPRTGTVTLVAMRSRPASGEPQEVPETRRWLDAIRNRLRARMPLGTRLAVVAPNYVQFSVSATLQAEPGRDPTAVKQQVEKTLRSRVVLVDIGDGTPPRQPGVPVTLRDVAAWMRLVDGVSRVTNPQLLNSTGQKVKEVAVSKSGLPRYNFRGSTIRVTRSGQGGAA
jgi:hypothetical protein